MTKDAMKSLRDFRNDESFESLVDIFSLISIALILATVVYGFKSNLALQAEKTSIKEIVDSANSSDVSLDDVFIIYVTNDSGRDMLIFSDSERGRRVLPVSREIVTEVLGREYSNLIGVAEIALMVDTSGTDTTQAIFADVQRWMAANEMGDKVIVGFSR